MGRCPAVHVAASAASVRRGGGLIARWPALVLLFVLLTGCGEDVAGVRGGNSLAGLDNAVADVGRTRSALLAVPADVVPVVSAFDDADDAAAAGDRAAARAAQSRAAAGLPAARAALDALPARAADYRAALRDLSAQAASAPGLDAGQRAALTDVTTAGEQEAAALEAAVGVVKEGWPAYDAVADALRAWLERAQAGWFRTAGEAAGGYAVLVGPTRAALTRTRDALAAADRERLAATDRQNARLDAADRALAPLRQGPPAQDPP